MRDEVGNLKKQWTTEGNNKKKINVLKDLLKQIYFYQRLNLSILKMRTLIEGLYNVVRLNIICLV